MNWILRSQSTWYPIEEPMSTLNSTKYLLASLHFWLSSYWKGIISNTLHLTCNAWLNAGFWHQKSIIYFTYSSIQPPLPNNFALRVDLRNKAIIKWNQSQMCLVYARWFLRDVDRCVMRHLPSKLIPRLPYSYPWKQSNEGLGSTLASHLIWVQISERANLVGWNTVEYLQGQKQQYNKFRIDRDHTRELCVSSNGGTGM